MIKRKITQKKLLLVVFYSFILLSSLTYITNNHVIPEAAGSDSAGYLLNAKTLLGQYDQKNLIPTKIPELPCAALDSMLTSRIQVNGTCETFSRLASYPTGLGIMHAVSIAIFGDNNFGRGFAMSFSYVGICILIYFFILEITQSRKIGLLGTLSFALAKQSIWSTASNISDLPGAFWVILTTYLFLQIRKKNKNTNNKYILLIIVSAISFWMLILTREVNVLAALPLFYLFFKFNKKIRVIFTLNIIVFGLPAMFARYYVNGVIFTDSYGGSLWNVMSSEWLARSAGNIFYLFISIIGVGVILPFIYLKHMEEIEWILVAQILAVAAFYVWYEFTGETWWDGRFLLCVIPSLIIFTSSRILKVSKILEQKLSTPKLYPMNEMILNIIIYSLIVTVILINNTVKFRNSSDTYNFLLNVYPTYRNVEPVIESLKKNYPNGAIIATMHLSASGRYYLNNEKYHLLWKPELEKLDTETIGKYYPKTVWVYNGWDLPPEDIRNKIITKEIVKEYIIGELDSQ